MRISDWSSDVCSSDLDGRSFRGSCIGRADAATDLEVVVLADGGGVARIVADHPRHQHTRLDRGHRLVHHALLLGVVEIGRAHVSTPVTNAHLVCRLLLEKKKKNTNELHNYTQDTVSH